MDSSIAVSPSPKISGADADTLPEKYGILCGFFNGLDSAIRLLKLKGSMPTFTNICPKVECLTDRRFSHGHLAQLKRILPEAIEIKRMLIFDVRTSCMKPELHVSIIVNAIDCGDEFESETKNLNLRRVFRARLADYFKAHPEGWEIPEEDLPEPFNRSKRNTQWSMITQILKSEAQPLPSGRTHSNSKLAVETLVDAVDDRLPVVASHVSQSFRKRFSRKTFSKAQEVSLLSTNFRVAELCGGKSVDGDITTSAPIQTTTKVLAEPAITEPSSILFLPATPIKEINPLKTGDKSPTESGCKQSTPAKLASTPARLMITTPTLQPQRTCYMSPDEFSSGLSNKSVRRPLRTRSLKFEQETIVDDTHIMGGSPVDNDDGVLPIQPESLLHAILEGKGN
ncbi:hypothetical protein GQ457_05G003240 [Hibiscus cannabinus]